MMRFQILSGLLLISAAIGCGTDEDNDAQLQKLRDTLILKVEPSDSKSAPSIRKSLKSEEGPKEQDVVVRGKIYAGDSSEPWEPGKAAFVLTDMTGHNEESDHDPWTCPFCSEHIEDYLVFVSFRDQKGNLLPIDARKLFKVKEKQIVVVKGRGSINENDELVLDATGIYIKK